MAIPTLECVALRTTSGFVLLGVSKPHFDAVLEPHLMTTRLSDFIGETKPGVER